MASSMVPSTTIVSVNRATGMVAPSTALKSSSAFPVTHKLNNDITSLASNGRRVQCMQAGVASNWEEEVRDIVISPTPFTQSLAKEVDYHLRRGWIPCLEFELRHGFVYSENHRSPGSYDGRYWTMWKLPMFWCTDSLQVLKELEEAKKAYPNAFIRIIGFDNKRQVQCISFIAYKPPGY